MDEKGAVNKIEEIEETESAFIKIGNGASTLVVSFAGNHHGGFARKTSLLELRNKRNDFDIISFLYMRNQGEWYLGGLNGIGETIEDTVAFLKKEFEKYDKVICIGSSAGGYASLLFGNLLDVNTTISSEPQVNLKHCPQCLPNEVLKLDAYEKWGDLTNIINSTTHHYIDPLEEHPFEVGCDTSLHEIYHFNLIKHLPNVIKYTTTWGRHGKLGLLNWLLDGSEGDMSDETI
jgi:hypothetical protein